MRVTSTACAPPWIRCRFDLAARTFPCTGDERGFADFSRYRSSASQAMRDPGEALLARCRSYGRFAVDHPGHYRLMFGPDLPASRPTSIDDAINDAVRRLTGLNSPA
jgi:hypothetical protein